VSTDGGLNPVPRATWVTKGIVSTVQGDDLQTDAQINHGTFGGQLLNARGEVVGITSYDLEGGGSALGVVIRLRALSSGNLSMPDDHPVDLQTIRRDPSGAVWSDEASNVSSPDRSGAIRVDAEHPPRNRKVGGSNPTSGSTSPQLTSRSWSSHRSPCLRL